MIAIATGEEENIVFNKFLFNISPEEEAQKYDSYSEKYSDNIATKRSKLEDKSSANDEGWDEEPSTTIQFTADKKYLSIEEYIKYSQNKLNQAVRKLESKKGREKY